MTTPPPDNCDVDEGDVVPEWGVARELWWRPVVAQWWWWVWLWCWLNGGAWWLSGGGGGGDGDLTKMMQHIV